MSRHSEGKVWRAALLQAAGHKVKGAKAALPFGLTRREAQVLAQLAKSETTTENAEALRTSPKTADRHIQNIYARTETRGRPAIALLALDYGTVMDLAIPSKKWGVVPISKQACFLHLSLNRGHDAQGTVKEGKQISTNNSIIIDAAADQVCRKSQMEKTQIPILAHSGNVG